MISKYFEQKKTHTKILKLLLKNENPDITDLKLKKDISKLNEFQHFNLFCNVFVETSFYPFTKENLSHFTKKRKKTNHKIDEFFPRSNFNTSNSEKEYFLTFNCKKNLYNLADKYINTKEYPKDTLITKLLVLKNNIIEYFITPLTIIIPTYKQRLRDSNNLFKENDEYLSDLIEELQQVEEKYLDLINEIENKINSFSREKIGNYLIDIKVENLNSIYQDLDKYDLVDIEKTSPEDFIEVLKSDWNRHTSVIYFKMNNIDFKYFINSFKQKLGNEIPLTFIEYAKNMKTKNGYIKADSINSAYSQSKKNTKNFEIIDSIFEKIKKD